MLYRKKPVVIEAVQWTGLNQAEIFRFCKDLVEKDKENGPVLWAERRSMSDPSGNRIYIKTLEGIHEATPGDWIIKGVKGEFYPCKPDIFELTYDPVD